MQHQAQLDRAKMLGGGTQYNYDDCFSLIAPEILKADYAVANLEVPLGGDPIIPATLASARLTLMPKL